MASATGHNTNLRFLDVGEEPNQVLLPIRGYAKEPLLPLEEAVQPISELLDDLEIMVHTAKSNSKKPADGLTVDESAAIHLYTMQWEEPNVSLFTKLNTTLRSKRREPLKPWFRYLKLALTALFKLPSVKATVWRGVRGNLSDQYDEEHIWWGFSSCTESMKVMEQFVGTTGVRTLFNIECINGKAIQKHSFYKDESEVLLLPGTYFRVVGKWSPAKDLYMIQLRETPAPHVYLEPPFGSAPAPAPSKPVVPPQAPAKEEKSSLHASAAPAKTKYKQEFAVPSTDKQLDQVQSFFSLAIGGYMPWCIQPPQKKFATIRSNATNIRGESRYENKTFMVV
ncbi:unnamed protein product [Adineta ricciae]|uniref:NAD(P)(+)--arginine ADP-ribosyltransferase n=1 Tax=Adineta ricciae TaxID=249248 RepID=A0A813R2I0_ADIRI|nr:unnamed protein product [Adineta ricciae]